MELLEREPFIQTLKTGFQRTIAGEGHSFFIMGEAGIGKSSLVKVFLQEIKDRSSVFTALCDSLFTPRPLGPIYDLALQMDGTMAQTLNALPSRTELFATLSQAFSQHTKAVIIVIEDIHWADEATLDFIKYFARRIHQTRCLFLLTYRDVEITSNHPLRNVLGELQSSHFTRIQLTPLSRSTVLQLANEKGYNGEDLYHISGGNPFYVNEILASYSDGIPDNIKDAVLSLYNRQQDITKHVWQVLSIMPEGLEYGWMNKIDANWQEAIERCLNYGILLIRNDRLVFKHELFRRTIESSFSPFKRLQLNSYILRLFLERFKETGAIERIVHYAKNAAENKLVVEYAPLAAEQAASVGAHTEAARLYLIAIEYTADKNADNLVHLYEAYTYECYLINQIQEAIIYQGKALKLWQAANEQGKVGNSLRFLSRLWWFNGHRQEAERYGLQAIELFEPLPPSKEKAMAFSNMSQLKMLSDDVAETVKWGTMAIDMAKAIEDEETLCHALNNVGAALWKIPASQQEGKKLLEESLHLALKNAFHEHAARAYTNLIACSVVIKDYATAEKYLGEGLQYCEERDLQSWVRYKLGWKTRLLLETGYWIGAKAIAKILMSYTNLTSIVKINALTVQAIINVRTGEEGAKPLLQEAKALAFVTMEHQRIIPVIVACLEYEWITGESLITGEELNTALLLIQTTSNIYPNVEAVYWLYKVKPDNVACINLYEQYEDLKASDGAAATAYATWANCPYEKALLLFEGDEEDKRKSLSLLQELGALQVYEKLKSDMRSSGIKKIPRGIRTSTKTNPAHLTNRELDILQLLKIGAPNKEIAAKLFISPKTVDNHISSILFKLDVPSRIKAVGEAERLGILK